MASRSSSPSLESFPRPAVAVDVALLTVTSPLADPSLRIFVRTSDGGNRLLPGRFIRERRTVAETLYEALKVKAGLVLPLGFSPRLLSVFDDPRRDDRTWALSLAHSLSLPWELAAPATGAWEPPSSVGELRFDHNAIVSAAVVDLQSRYEFRGRSYIEPDPDGFLGDSPFTLFQLRKVHEAVVGEPLHKDNFAKRMTPLLRPLLDADGEPVLAQNLRGRPAALYEKA
ncbi:hypothetical protein ATK17_2383 [Branchiibius hedensis]|uniref:NrtR DNA-binding winged helix domain-containing protein n=1 Tax=Branchiibius hedensis TaxID=672460 RepID=A0A2Y8ZUU6_9MICO|nr:NUDIX hydrolase [Branchiibius hedensis]PWJ26236.1 hypothetical protein ATK17_2383 [Branchiibius hedensis]SSA35048.1 hypothetical protein SAMN04489750_2383 [Branchiibius hedensis]